MAAYEARRTELTLYATKVTLTASKGETAATQAMVASALPHIMGKDLLCLDVLSVVHNF